MLSIESLVDEVVIVTAIHAIKDATGNPIKIRHAFPLIAGVELDKRRARVAVAGAGLEEGPRERAIAAAEFDAWADLVLRVEDVAGADGLTGQSLRSHFLTGGPLPETVSDAKRKLYAEVLRDSARAAWQGYVASVVPVASSFRDSVENGDSGGDHA
jgi:hypothetical protein